MLEVDQVLQCKQLHAAGESIRSIAKMTGFARRTVRAYVSGERLPGEYKLEKPRPRPVLERVEETVREWLETERERETPKKQRLTAARIYRLLVQDGHKVAESSVRRLVREIRQDLRDPLESAYLPLEYDPGIDAQVDFFEGVVDRPSGERDKAFFLLVRACYSGRTFCYAAPNQTREALLEGLVRAFDHFGGVFRKLWFDNLTPAVRKVLRGRSREVQQGFESFRAHYGFEAEFCAPGKGNEKGGVENAVKYSRHEIISPIPVVEDRDALQARCNEWMEREDSRSPRGQESTIEELWSREIEHLLPIPAARFEIGEVRSARVTPRSWISVHSNCYSVPVEWVGREVVVRLGAEGLTITGRPGDPPVRHRRAYGQKTLLLELDHYLPLLARKHRGLDRAAPVRRWLDTQDPCWKELLRQLRRRNGEIDGGKSFIDVLFLVRTHGVDSVTNAVKEALTHPEVSIALIRLRLDGRAEGSHRGGALSDYESPDSRVGRIADYMGLMSEQQEVTHG